MRSNTPLIAILLLALTSVAAAQNGTEPPAAPLPVAPALVDRDYESPAATMATFIEAMQDHDQATADGHKEAQAKALDRAVATLALTDATRVLGHDIAKQLYKVRNRIAECEPWYLWDAEAAKGHEEQTYFPHQSFDYLLDDHPQIMPKGAIVLQRQADGGWLFSADTIKGLNDLFRSVEKLPVIVGQSDEAVGGEAWLRSLMPNTLKQNTLLTLEYWQWVAMLIFIFIGVAIDHLSRLFLRLAVTRVIQRRGAEPDPERMRLFVRPTGLLLSAVFWVNTLWLLHLPVVAYPIVSGAARVFAVLATIWALWRLTDLIIDALLKKAESTDTKFDDVVYPMIRTTIRIFIFVFGFIYGGLALNINIWPAITALGIGGVGFAFAAKDTLENFFGSATVLIDRPFGVGDWVVIGDVEGTVEEIGFRSTRVRTFYNSLISVPNANLVRASVDNYGRRRYRRWKCLVGVEYGTSPEKLTAFCEGIRELVRTHPYTRKDYFQVWLNGFGPSSLDILVYVFYETPDWSTELRERERLILDMIRLANSLGVSFAFPTQTLHIQNDTDTPPSTPADAPTSMTERRAKVEGIRATQELIANQPWQKDVPGAVEYKHGPTELDLEDTTQIEQRGAGG